MKIVDVRVCCVAIPLNAMLRHNTGVHPGYLLRTVLEVFTDEGVIGLGEVGGGDQRAALMKLKPCIISACRVTGNTLHMQFEEGDGIPNSIGPPVATGSASARH